mmetsp:Transcript_5820/g.15625  ORF Transcript_5820/g.15625 Transcript_5820/m.15625 type:complete len:200 (+) Transcript_5820:425-1024(+)
MRKVPPTRREGRPHLPEDAPGVLPHRCARRGPPRGRRRGRAGADVRGDRERRRQRLAERPRLRSGLRRPRRGAVAEDAAGRRQSSCPRPPGRADGRHGDGNRPRRRVRRWPRAAGELGRHSLPDEERELPVRGGEGGHGGYLRDARPRGERQRVAHAGGEPDDTHPERLRESGVVRVQDEGGLVPEVCGEIGQQQQHLG